MSPAAYRIDGDCVSERDFYARACDPARSCVVEACAGAGKTWMLVSRIVRALLDGSEPQHILAITFTRKAAGEMRARLQEWLAHFATLDAAACTQELTLRGVEPARAAQLAPDLQALQARVLASGRRVEIRTFHGWFTQLLQAAPLSLLQAQGLPPQLGLIVDDAVLRPLMWRRFYAQVQQDADLQSALDGLVAAHGRHLLEKWLEAALVKRMDCELADAAGTWADGMPPFQALGEPWASWADPMAAWPQLCTALLPLAREWMGGRTKTQRDAGAALDAALHDGLAAPQALARVRKALLTDKGEPRRHLLGTSSRYEPILEALQGLQAALDQQTAQRLHAQAVPLARMLLRTHAQLKRERGLVDMGDLERGARALLADASVAGEVQQRLDARVRHLLVDEFQDTSPLQWHTLQDWLASYAGAGGGSQAPVVFLVGDPKQSIYRFRGAEPRVFEAARDFVAQAFDGAHLACDHTRRNAPAVVAAVNAVFGAAAAAGHYPGFRSHTTAVAPSAEAAGLWQLPPPEGSCRAAEANGGEGGDDDAPGAEPLRWRPSLSEPRSEPETRRRAEEAGRVADAVAAMCAEAQPPSIFVLARKREALREVAQALKARGVPHSAPEASAVLDGPEGRDLLALCDALLTPGHDLALAQALRAPLLGASSQDLGHLAAQAQAQQLTWWAALQQLPDASPTLVRAAGLLAAWRERAMDATPHELLDAIVHEGEWMQRLAAAAPPSEREERLHSLSELLLLALDWQAGRYASLPGFVHALRHEPLQRPALPATGHVQLLTIHGAKGLEADVVFLVDTDSPPSREARPGLLIDWPVQRSAPRGAAFVVNEAQPPPALAGLSQEVRAQREREEWNALYVAMTRARRALVVSCGLSARASSATTWWALLSPLASVHAVPMRAGAQRESGQALLNVLPPLARGLAVPRLPSAVDSATARLGEALHRVLEWASGPAASAPLDELARLAAQQFGLDAARALRLHQAAAAILHSPACAPFFDPARLRWAGNEVPLAVQGQDARADRIVCFHGATPQAEAWWVIDYKLHPAPQRDPDYVAQLQGYAQALQALQPACTVRAAFITAEGALIEVTG